jgi:hypothetical protein
MSDVQFQTKDWNPFTAAAGLLDQFLPKPEKEKTVNRQRHYDTAMAHQRHTEQTVLTRKEKPTPANTGAPVPGYRKRGPINPSTTGAPVPGTLKKNTATHPITGEKVPRTPVKPKGAKPTAPGTRPKKK